MFSTVCEWPAVYPDDTPCNALASLPASGQARFEQMAAEYLWRYTGRQFGQCEGVIRPCRQDCFEGVSTYGSDSRVGSPWQPTLIGGRWFNVGCGGGCADTCGCGSWGSVLRFETPVTEVVAVEVDGVLLDPSAYRVDGYRLLVRQDGGRWPYCQNMSLPLGTEGTWAVTVKIGAPVPIGGQVAAGKLACQLALAASGAKECELPQRWQTITRQGVTIAAGLDAFDDLDAGKTGIWLIDSWVASVTKPDIGFSVAVPNLRTAGRRTTWGG